ncbi:hypothetical protein Q0M94_28095 (plasmid) [Deinococcus radiomollis]|uniref:hypothetical protein n=1 Tax=Deinococcus radiomollis TaxID=468916 RepID=UPI0038924FED
MNKNVPPVLFWALAWVASAAFLAVAVIEWRLGSTYHAVLALVIAVLLIFTGRGQRPTWITALLLVAMLAFAVYRSLLGLALLRGR